MVIMDRCVGEAATIPDPEAEPLEGRVRDLEQEVRDLRRLVEEQGLLIANLRRAVRVTGAAFSAAG